MSKVKYLYLSDIKDVFVESYGVVFKNWKAFLMFSGLLVVISAVTQYMKFVAMSEIIAGNPSAATMGTGATLLSVVIYLISVYLMLNLLVGWFKLVTLEGERPSSFTAIDKQFWKMTGLFLCLILLVLVVSIPMLLIFMFLSKFVLVDSLMAWGPVATVLSQFVTLYLVGRLLMAAPMITRDPSLPVMRSLKQSLRLTKGAGGKVALILTAVVLPYSLISIAANMARHNMLFSNVDGQLKATNEMFAGILLEQLGLTVLFLFMLAVGVSAIAKLYGLLLERGASVQ